MYPQVVLPPVLKSQVGVCVVAGNVRRTAEIAFGDPESEEYIDLKNYDKNPSRSAFGWASNNSVFAQLGMDYSEVRVVRIDESTQEFDALAFRVCVWAFYKHRLAVT